MRFARHSLSVSAYSIAGGMYSEPSGPISIPRNFPICGRLSKIGFALRTTIYSTPGGFRSKAILRSPRALPNTSTGNGFPIRRCGQLLRTRLFPLQAQGNEELVRLQTDADTGNLRL